MTLLEGKRILVTGGTGSLGQTLVRRLLTAELGKPASITVYSRDEAKQHYMRLDYMHRDKATDDVIYQNSQDLLRFRIGDVRDYPRSPPRCAKATSYFTPPHSSRCPRASIFRSRRFRQISSGPRTLYGLSVKIIYRLRKLSVFRPIRPASR